ncbi:MAG: hypothetical protein JST53_01415, partial [Actinobacteria bacterium]|nr:hypothetical protein [Actinomycetota bacterium]
PAIYNYYDSKEHILAAASRDALRRFFTAVFGPLAEDPEEKRLELVVRRWVAFQIEERAIARWNDSLIDTGTLKRVLPTDEWRHIAAALRAPLELLAGLLDSAPGTDPRLLAVAIAAACDRSGRRLGPDHPLDREGVADQIWLLCRRMSAIHESSGLATV